MAAAKTIKSLAGIGIPDAEFAYTPPAEPQDPSSTGAAVRQLQNTVNALIAALRPPAGGWIVSGGVVTKDTGALTVDSTAGELEKQDGTYVPIIAASNLALAAADITNPRVDLVQVNQTTGVVTKKNGTAAVAPVAPSVDAGNIGLATVPVPANATEPSTPTDVRPRPARAFTGASAPATNLFTAS